MQGPELLPVLLLLLCPFLKCSCCLLLCCMLRLAREQSCVECLVRKGGGLVCEASAPDISLCLLFLGRYDPVTKTVEVDSKGGVQVNFTLSRTDAKVEEGKVPVLNTPDTSDPNEKEFETLIKDLSAENGLERLLLASSGKVSPYRYRPYKDLSEFLRGLYLNYPHITNLTR